MSHVVIITSHMAGRINATCELTRRLRRADVEVTLASPVDIGDRVAAQGLDYVHIGPPGDSSTETNAPDAVAEHPLRRIVGLLRRLVSVTEMREKRKEAVSSLDLDALQEWMAGVDPDLYLIDIELPTHIMVATNTRSNVAVWTTMLSLWKRKGLPPLHTDIVPGVGWRGTRMGIELAWLRFRAWKWLRRQRLRVTRVGSDQMSVLRAVAARTSFALGTETDAHQWLIPFVYRKLPTLMFNAREIEFPHDPHPVCRYVGPLLNSGRRLAQADAEQREVSDRLEEIYARRLDRGRDGALVYCAFGGWHTGDDREFFSRVFAAVAAHPDWDVVFGLGGRIHPDEFREVPDNVHLFGWAPQMEVLAHADVAIHHAGISSINECVTSGVPMVVFPYDYGDTAGAAARVVYHGIGVRGDRSSDTVATIRRHVEEVLTKPEFRRNVTALRGTYASYESSAAAVEAVLALL